MSLLQRYGYVLMYWGIFVGILGAFVTVNEMWRELVEVHFSTWTAEATGWVMRLIGMGAEVRGIRLANEFCRFIIIGECTAYYPIGIYLAAVLAYPVPWTRKLLGVVIGLPVIVAFNLFRLVSLCYIFRWWPDLFHAIHALVWQSLMIFFTIVVWMLWVSTIAHYGHDTRST
jgi:archaeosortase B (VPXXXP-CTERM-specific)